MRRAGLRVAACVALLASLGLVEAFAQQLGRVQTNPPPNPQPAGLSFAPPGLLNYLWMRNRGLASTLARARVSGSPPANLLSPSRAHCPLPSAYYFFGMRSVWPG